MGNDLQVAGGIVVFVSVLVIYFVSVLGFTGHPQFRYEAMDERPISQLQVALALFRPRHNIIAFSGPNPSTFLDNIIVSLFDWRRRPQHRKQALTSHNTH